MARTLEVILVLPQETDRLQDCLAARTSKVQRLPEYRANKPISTRECSRIAPPDHTTPWGVFGTGFYPIQWPPCSLRTYYDRGHLFTATEIPMSERPKPPRLHYNTATGS